MIIGIIYHKENKRKIINYLKKICICKYEITY